MKKLGPRYGSIAARLGYSLKAVRYGSDKPNGVIVVTHCGKLGDFIACLPVASWLYKTRGHKIHFVLAKQFAPFAQIRSLLMLQEMTHEVTLADFPIVDWEKGGEPYIHNPNDYGVEAREYYNLGFRRTPRRFVPQYIAEEFGLGYDPDFVLSLGHIEPNNSILVSDAHMLSEVPNATPIDHTLDFLTNARLMAGARESHVAQGGLFHILDWAGVTPNAVYIYPHAVNIHLFSQRLSEHNLKYIERVVRPLVK